MSGYEYGDKSGYADHTSQPVSFVTYDGTRGTRTYVTRVEERVERVRRPTIVGYSYSSTMKEKEGRPREVDDFLTKILDEVNGPSVTRVDHTSDYGVGYKFGGDSPKKVYEIEYVYVGSPTSSRRSGDPYYQQWLSSGGYDHPPQRDYGVPNQPPDHDFPKDHWVKFSSPNYYAVPNNSSRVESPRDDGVVPNNRGEWSSHPTYKGAPNNPPPSIESLSLKSAEVHPDSPKDGVPNSRWGKQSSPVYDQPTRRDYGDPDNRWSRSSNPNYDQPKSNSQWGHSPGKPLTYKDYGDGDNQWSRSSKPTNSSLVKPVSKGGDRSTSPEYDQTPRNDYGPNNRWGNPSVKPSYDNTPPNEANNKSLSGRSMKWGGNSPLKPAFDQAQSNAAKGPSGVPENQRDPTENRDIARDTQSPRGHGARNNQGGGSSSPNYDPPLDEGSNNGGPPIGLQRYYSMKPQSPKGYGALENQMGGSQISNYEKPSNNSMLGGVPKTQLDDSPQKTHSPRDKGAREIQWGKPSSPVYNSSPQNPNQEQKHGFPKGYEVSSGPKERSTSPGYEHPPRYEIVVPPPPPLKVRIPQNNGTVDRVDNKQGSNTPVKAQTPVYDHSLPNAVRPNVPGVSNKPNFSNNTYGLEPKGNKYSQSNKPLGQSYD